jgi:uncharacterized protein (TIGR02147 family)
MSLELTRSISIFDFDNFKDYLIASGLPDGKYGHSSHNLKSWANRLGYKHASSLSMVLSGERLPSKDMFNKLSEDFSLSQREKHYFELLIKLEKHKRQNKDVDVVLKEIQKLLPESNHFSIDLKQFKVISEWYVISIKQLIDTKEFVEDEEWICRRLRGKVTPSQVRHGLQNLIDLGIVDRDKNGKLYNAKAGLITSNDVPSSAIRKHHYGMLERAQDALVEQETHERQINSITMRIDPEKLPEAKKMLFDFLKDFSGQFESEDSSEVYQLNMQLFQLTEQLRMQ